MKVVGICCSPRLKGNTEIMVEEALAGAKEACSEVELIRFAGKSIAPCDSCHSCLQTGRCHIKDDMQAIYDKLEQADGIILGSPTYFANVSAQAKIFMDRTYPYVWNKKLLGKVGGVVITERRVAGGALLGLIYSYFARIRILAAGGTVGREAQDKPYGDKAAVRADVMAMKEAKAVGRNVVKIAMKLRG